MRLINQKNGVDCGIAVAAMIANQSYDYAAEADPSPEKATGLSPSDLIYTIEGLTGQPYNETRKGRGKPLALYGLPRYQSAILIRELGRRFGHWIATDGKRVFDPELTVTCLLDEYARRNWSIVRIIEEMPSYR